MEKLNGWENASSFGDFKSLEAGVYKCIVNKAEELTSNKGKKFIKITLDIIEGDFKNYFKEKYDKDTRPDKKWSGIWNLFEEGYDAGSVNSKFKGLIASIERSNIGFIWDWNEQKLAGKVLGIVFREEEFKANDGSIKSSAKPFYAIPVEDISKTKIPEPKLLSDEIGSIANNDEFASFSGDDLPF